MPFWRRPVEWIDRRLALSESLMPMLRHPIPRAVAGPMGWWYVFGSASLTLLMHPDRDRHRPGPGLRARGRQGVRQPALSRTTTQPLGWFLRALHYYAGSGMVVLVLAHMTQVFLHGAYKYPRELTWVVGVCLLLCTLGMFFTGQVLRWDPDAYWGLAVGGLDGRAGPRLLGRRSCGCCWAAPSSAATRSAASSPCTSSSFPARLLVFAGGASVAGAQMRDQRAAGSGPTGRSRRPTTPSTMRKLEARRSVPGRCHA